MKPYSPSPNMLPDRQCLLCPSILSRLLNSYQTRSQNLVFVCIGTDRIIGDSLGPIVGSMLHNYIESPSSAAPFSPKKTPDFYIYGTLQDTVHALNLAEITEKIQKKHANDTIIAIDASLGSKKDIGSVFVRTGTLFPGSGVCKTLPPLGDITITGITGEQTRHPYLTLQTVRLSAVTRMAEHICSCILSVCQYSL